MTRYLNKDTQVCISLAARPSNFGTRFHNFLYDAMSITCIKPLLPRIWPRQLAACGHWDSAVVQFQCRLKRRLSRW